MDSIVYSRVHVLEKTPSDVMPVRGIVFAVQDGMGLIVRET